MTGETKTNRSNSDKHSWSGHLLAIQPRIRLLRSFDQRHHQYQGYVLKIDGMIGDEARSFLVAIGKGAQQKRQFRAGMDISGQSVPVADHRLEIAEFYKTSKLKVEKDDVGQPSDGPPFLDAPPDLETYRSRGHRRLAAKTYETKCSICIWGCRMPVEMIVDHWNPSQKRYRFETFCYGPKSCSFYKAGPTRKVPGRKGMSWEEEDWIDEDATAHRGPDD